MVNPQVVLSPFSGVRRWVAAAAFALVAGCAANPPQPASPGEEAQEESDSDLTSGEAPAMASEPENRSVYPNQELTENLLYEYLLAEIAVQRGSVALSAQAYVDLAKRTRDPRIARRATEVALFARMNNAAIDAATIWHEADPASTRALEALAGMLVSVGRYDEALPRLKELLASPTGDPASRFTLLPRMLANAQDKQAALKLTQNLAADYPRVPEANFAIARMAVNAGEDRIALDEVRKARKLRPDSESAVLLEAQILQKTSPDQAAAVALLSLQLKDYDSAEKYLKGLLNTPYRDKDGVRLYLGQVAEERKDLPEALKWYGEVGEGEQYVQAQIRYAQVLARQGKLDEARAGLQRAAAKNSQQRIQLILAEAQLLRDANQPKAAFDLVGQALDRAPNNPDLLYDYAMLAEKIERVDILESALRKLIEIRPEHAHAYNALGYSLADRNQRLPEAQDLIEKALKLAPDDFFIIDSMGWVLYRRGQLKDSLAYLRRAYAGRPDAEIAAHLGEVLWALGERSEAERVWGDAAKESPDNETLTNTIKRLKR